MVSSGVSLTLWGESASLALVGHPSSDGVTIKIPCRVNVLLHQCLTVYLSVFDLFLTQCIMVILSGGFKPDNFESHNSLKLCFMNILGLSNFVECESFLDSNSLGILALCETNLDHSVESGNFSVRGYLPLIQKDSIILMHGLAVYVNKGLPFAQELSLGNSTYSYLCF